jgi:hypothetical protein
MLGAVEFYLCLSVLDWLVVDLLVISLSRKLSLTEANLSVFTTDFNY